MRSTTVALTASLGVLLLGTAAPAAPPPSPWTTQRVSVSAQGKQAQSYSYEPAVSGDGRFMAYFSDAANLVPGDTNGRNDVFVYDSATGAVERVSVTSSGGQSARGGWQPAISDDGRFVAFSSDADDLVPGDSNGFGDIFVRDRWNSTTTRVSVASDGHQQTGGGASGPEISGDGRYIVYWSYGSDLVAGDTNEDMDVFRYDRVTGTTVRVSVGTDGTQGNARSGYPGGPDISDDGRYVVFESEASNLVPNDGNGNALDVFTHDVTTGQTTLVSVATDGTPGNIDSYWPSVSDDGRLIAFNSDATNLIPSDTNGEWDIFVRDLATGTTILVSVATDGIQGNNISYPPDISGNGRYVTFFAIADNLVPGDTNSTWDIFVHDIAAGRTERVSVSSRGLQANGGSQLPSISDNGQAITYESDATNLVRPDTNRNTDAYLSRHGA